LRHPIFGFQPRISGGAQENIEGQTFTKFDLFCFFASHPRIFGGAEENIGDYSKVVTFFCRSQPRIFMLFV